ncbi:MAG: acetyl-CoA carboxylase carboxyltransferase subunit alpha, partial [Phycisphaerae bacterium]
MMAARGKNKKKTAPGKVAGNSRSVPGAVRSSEGVLTAPLTAAAGTPGRAQLGLHFEQPMLQLERQIQDLIVIQEQKGVDYSAEIMRLRDNLTDLLKKTYDHLSAWETVQVARHPARPQTRDYIDLMVKEFEELHGDRHFGDDQAMVTGTGRIGSHKVLLVGHQKGRNTKEKIMCNFGCAHPEGYRKALLKMQLAAKFKLPIVALIDTPGAYPGLGSEERGVAEAIAVNLRTMAVLPTPIVCIVIGEGGSGGALGIGVGDRLAMLQYAWYSVISPEGCSGILWKGSANAADAAAALKLTSKDLKQLGLIDDVIREPLGGAHRNPRAAAEALERYIDRVLRELKTIAPDDLVDRRYQRL